MSYAALESSAQDGAPVELYLFECGTQVWRYTSAESNLSFDGEMWVSVPIQRGGVEATFEQARNAVQVSMPRNLDVPELYRIAPRTDVVALTIFRFHRGDGEAVVLWMGRVLNVEWTGAAANLNCEPASISFGRSGLRRLYQKGCPHVLYSSSCGLSKEAHALSCEVVSIDGSTVTVDALGERNYAGGFIEWEADGIPERRFIRSVAGLVLTLAFPVRDLSPGDSVTAYPGCAHTMQACEEFENLPNYGGMPYIPTKNPFDGTPVY